MRRHEVEKIKRKWRRNKGECETGGLKEETRTWKQQQNGQGGRLEGERGEKMKGQRDEGWESDEQNEGFVKRGWEGN